jgi:hypothetical protein
MEGLFGARLVDTLTASEVTLKVVAPLGNLKLGDTFPVLVRLPVRPTP